LLKSHRLDAAATENAIETIGRNAISQKDLINDLLDVSRIIAGKLVIRFEPVDLSFVLIAAIETVRPATESKDIRIFTDIQPIRGLSLGDESRLQQVFWNLLTNAIKFTPRGGTITAKLQDIGGHAQVTIADTGIGIKPELLPYVFDRFRQADGSTTRRHGGLGLGLSIVRHLVELHGGTASVTSPGEGKGSTFQVTLPLKTDDRLT
jgi:signal transduction histidine kinase